MPMRSTDRYHLLHGSYTAPALKRGDRATCLYRDADVIVTGWSAGRIPWPRCRLPGTHGGRAAIWFPRSEPHSLHAVAPAAGPRSDDEGKVTYDPLQLTPAAVFVPESS
jgi:hypothetical protein